LFSLEDFDFYQEILFIGQTFFFSQSFQLNGFLNLVSANNLFTLPFLSAKIAVILACQ